MSSIALHSHFNSSVTNITDALLLMKFPKSLRHRIEAHAGLFNSSSEHARRIVCSNYCMKAWVIRAEKYFSNYGHSELVSNSIFHSHIELFGLFALSVSIIDRSSLEIDVFMPDRVELPIPCTHFKILNICGGKSLMKVHVDGGRVTSAGASIVKRSKREYFESIELGYEPSFSDDESLKSLLVLQGSELRSRKWIELLELTWAVLKLDTKACEFVSMYCSALCGMAKEEANVHHSLSAKGCPGVVFVSFCDDPMVLAEALVHECDHQMLYTLDRIERFFDPERRSDDLYPSPWRLDPRPIEGIFFGASAFVRVCSFWANVLPHLDRADSKRVGYLGLLANLQSREAIGIAKNAKGLTDPARRYLSRLARINEESHAILRSIKFYDECKEKAIATIHEHIEARSTYLVSQSK